MDSNLDSGFQVYRIHFFFNNTSRYIKLFARKCHNRAVPRIFCLWGQTPHTPHRGLPYADRVSSWTLILFSLLHRKLPLRRLEKKKNTPILLVLNCHDALSTTITREPKIQIAMPRNTTPCDKHQPGPALQQLQNEAHCMIQAVTNFCPYIAKSQQERQLKLSSTKKTQAKPS